MDNTTDIQRMILRERRMAVSEREWKHRLRGYGYGIRDTDEGRVVTSLRNDRALFALQGGIAA